MQEKLSNFFGQRLKEVLLGQLGIGAKSAGDQLAHECLAFCQFDIIQVVHFFKVAELKLCCVGRDEGLLVWGYVKSNRKVGSVLGAARSVIVNNDGSYRRRGTAGHAWEGERRTAKVSLSFSKLNFWSLQNLRMSRFSSV